LAKLTLKLTWPDEALGHPQENHRVRMYRNAAACMLQAAAVLSSQQQDACFLLLSESRTTTGERRQSRRCWYKRIQLFLLWISEHK
jgi:hypothetical protein